MKSVALQRRGAAAEAPGPLAKSNNVRMETNNVRQQFSERKKKSSNGSLQPFTLAEFKISRIKTQFLFYILYGYLYFDE